MKKYGIGTGIFAIIFGLITFFAAKIFFSILAGAGDVDALFIGVFVALGGFMMIVSAVVGVITGFLTIALFISTIDRVRSAIKQAKFKKQQAA